MSHPEIMSAMYRAFGSVPVPKRIPACPCCLDEEGVCVLLSKELAALSPEELSSYASSVFLTVGSKADFHYFLPRILDVMRTNPGWWPDPEVVGRAIGTFGWDNFSVEQRAALETYFNDALSSFESETEPDGYRIDSWLCCTSRFLPDWAKYLESIQQRSLALVALYEWHGPALRRGDLANGFWDDSPRKGEFKKWLVDLVESGAVNSAYGL